MIYYIPYCPKTVPPIKMYVMVFKLLLLCGAKGQNIGGSMRGELP